MPEPERFAEVVDKIRDVSLEPVIVSSDQLAQIQQPALIVTGDQDDYAPVGAYVRIYEAMPHAQLLVLPEHGHVHLILNAALLTDFVIPFLQKN